MALFNKLFTSLRRVDNFESRDFLRSFQIAPEQVRLLLFKESDWRGRKLLFDSATIKKVPVGKDAKAYTKLPAASDGGSIIEVSEGFAYEYTGAAQDAGTLGEMIFGAVAMNYKGVPLKIHMLDDPIQLLCSKVFLAPVSRKVSRCDRKVSVEENLPSSKPLNMPKSQYSEEGIAFSFSIERGDSGFYCENSPNSSVSSTYDYCSMFDAWDGVSSQDDLYSFHTPPNSRKLSACSAGSLQRRMFRNVSTRFDFGSQSSNYLTVPPLPANTSYDSQIYSESGCTASGTSDSLTSNTSSGSGHSKTKLGLALLIRMTDGVETAMMRQCVEHSPQLEALVCRLRLAVMLSGVNRRDRLGFIATLHQASRDAATWLSDLMNGPRLPSAWLNLVTSKPDVTSKMSDLLISDMCAVLSMGDTKHTNFFMSTLITHVLTYHLSWVTTVSPYDACVEPSTNHEAKSPYNALWAQLSDLCGCIGYPPRTAKTIISGKHNTPFINKLLLVLTYFIRCGDVSKNNFEFQDVDVESSSDNVNDNINNIKETCVNLNDIKKVFSETKVNKHAMLRTSTTTDLSQMLSNVENKDFCSNSQSTSRLKRKPTVVQFNIAPDSSLSSNSEDAAEQKSVVFVLGDDDKLVGLKNKSIAGKSVKKSSKTQSEPVKPCDLALKIEAVDVTAGQPVKQDLGSERHESLVVEYETKLKRTERKFVKLETEIEQQQTLNVKCVQDEIQCAKQNVEINLAKSEAVLEVVNINKQLEINADIIVASNEIITVIPTINGKLLDPTETDKPCNLPEETNNKILSLPEIAEPVQSNCQGPIFHLNTNKERTIDIPNREKNAICELTLNRRSVSPERCLNISASPIKRDLETSNTPNREVESLVNFEKDSISSTVCRKDEMNCDKDLNSPVRCDIDAISPSRCDRESESPLKCENDLTSTTRCARNSISPSRCSRDSTSPSKCCGQQQHSKPIKHSGFKFEFDKYPQIVTNYMKSKNLEILDRHYIGKPGNLKLDNFQFDPTVVPPIQEEEKEICYKCQQMESMLQTPTNASELEFMSDMPGQSELQYAKEHIVKTEIAKDFLPKTFIRKKCENTLLVNLTKVQEEEKSNIGSKDKEAMIPKILKIVDVPTPSMDIKSQDMSTGYHLSLLGGVTDHYIPDMILQGTMASPSLWESDLRRDLDLTTHVSKSMDNPIQAVAIIADCNCWEVRVVGGHGASWGSCGMSGLVGAMLDALPHMWRARVPAHQCISFIESKLREFCVLSKTLAEILMSGDVCDMATLTKALNIDVNDVPLLLAVATTHSPQVARRYGISYR